MASFGCTRLCTAFHPESAVNFCSAPNASDNSRPKEGAPLCALQPCVLQCPVDTQDVTTSLGKTAWLRAQEGVARERSVHVHMQPSPFKVHRITPCKCEECSCAESAFFWCRRRAWRRPRRGGTTWPRCAACCSTRRASSSTWPRSSPRTTTAGPSRLPRQRCETRSRFSSHHSAVRREIWYIIAQTCQCFGFGPGSGPVRNRYDRSGHRTRLGKMVTWTMPMPCAHAKTY